MSQDDYGMGGSMLSSKEKERITRDLKEFQQSLENKKKKKKEQQIKPIAANNTTVKMDESRNFSYTYLLNRIFSQLEPSQGCGKAVIGPEIVQRDYLI
eukprot:UN05785